MENPNGLYVVSFTPKGYLVNQLLQEGWGWDAAVAHADLIFSADGTRPSHEVQTGNQSWGGPELSDVTAYIAACDQPGDDYQPRAEEVLCGGLEVHA